MARASARSSRCKEGQSGIGRRDARGARVVGRTGGFSARKLMLVVVVVVVLVK